METEETRLMVPFKEEKGDNSEPKYGPPSR